MDIKACHGYLLMELLSAWQRPGLYGGSFENRTRLLRNGIAAAKVHENGQFLVTARLGIYDGFAWPYGFGVKEGKGAEPDMEEPIRLVRELHEEYGLPMVNLTMGNPYVNTHVTRPFDGGKYIPEEHPLFGVARIMNGIGQMKKRFRICSSLPPGRPICDSIPICMPPVRWRKDCVIICCSEGCPSPTRHFRSRLWKAEE